MKYLRIFPLLLISIFVPSITPGLAKCDSSCSDRCATNNFSLKCETACDKALTQCLREADRQDRENSERRLEAIRSAGAIRTCRALPTNGPAFENAAKRAWILQRDAFEDGQKTLKGLRDQLENEAEWNIGDNRQMLTYLAKVTKTSADLLSDTIGFSGEKLAAGRAKEIYEKIKTGKTVYKVMEDAAKALVDIVLDEGADLNVAIRAVKTIKDLSENIASIAKTPGEIADAKREIGVQLGIIDAQIGSLEKRLDQINHDHVQDVARSLFETVADVKQLCEGGTSSKLP